MDLSKVTEQKTRRRGETKICWRCRSVFARHLAGTCKVKLVKAQGERTFWFCPGCAGLVLRMQL